MAARTRTTATKKAAKSTPTRTRKSTATATVPAQRKSAEATPAKTDLTAFLTGLIALAHAALGDVAKIADDEADETEAAPATKTARKTAATKSKAKAEPEPEDDDDDDDESEEEVDYDTRKAELSGMRITSLRKIALQFFTDKDVEGADKPTLIENILGEEFPDEEGDDEEGDDESELPSRAELQKMTLAQVKGVARENGIAAGEYKGLDKDSIIDMILEEGDEDDDDDDDDEDEDDLYTEDELKEKSDAELKAIYKEVVGSAAKRGTSRDDLIEAILEAEDEDEDE